MTRIVPKSPIPESRAFIIKRIDAPYFDPTLHFHPENQLSLVLKGTGTRFIGDNIKAFKEGDLVLTGSNLPHVWRNDNSYFDKKNGLSTTVVVIYFHDHFLGESVTQKEELQNIHHLLQKSVRGLEITGKTKRIVIKMMMEMLKLKGVESVIQLLKILDMIAKSRECHFITHQYFVSLNNTAETNRMNKIYEYVMKNFMQKINLVEIAAIANMTPTSFSRYFTSRVNKSFSDFLKDIRINHACKLLSEEKMTIERVGYECGFHTLSNFNKQFKKVTGKQPHQYRNEYLKIQNDVYTDF